MKSSAAFQLSPFRCSFPCDLTFDGIHSMKHCLSLWKSNYMDIFRLNACYGTLTSCGDVD